MSAETWNAVISVNLLAPIQFTLELLPSLAAQGGGHILNVCSALLAGRPNGPVAVWIRQQVSAGSGLRPRPSHGRGPRSVPCCVHHWRRYPVVIVRLTSRLSFRGADVVDVLERVCREIGFRCNDPGRPGAEFVSRYLDLWAYQPSVMREFSRASHVRYSAWIAIAGPAFKRETTVLVAPARGSRVRE